MKPTPAADPHEVLVATLGALRLECEPSQVQALLRFLAMLARWNAVYNLTSVRDPAQMMVRHLADCLAVVPSLRRHAQGRHLRLLDVGSGGGLPGAVLAIMCPEWRVTCVDSVGKKSAFIQQVAGELAIGNLAVCHARVEAMPAAPHDLIVSRAFASLDLFVRLTRRLLEPDGVWVAMKAHVDDAELDRLPVEVATMFHVEPIAVPGLAEARCLVWMRAAGRQPAQSPSL